jgi:hypothetical protein
VSRKIADWFRDFFGWLFGRTTAEQAERAWKNSLLVAMGLGGFALVVYAASQPSFWPVFGGGVLVATASALAGGFGGLIFGVPRSATSSSSGQATAQNPRQVAPNTNLVEVSDWLTKIIVGLGLTQLGSMPGDFQRLVDYAYPALGSAPAATSVVGALIVAYAIAGFMLTYLFTRLDLEAEMEAAEAEPDPDLKKLSGAMPESCG